MKRALVIGGGFGGCTAIHELSKKGWDVTLIEPSEKLGGGVRTTFRSGHPCTLGPRHFLTQHQPTFEYICEKLPMRLCKEHEFVSYVSADHQFYSYPIHYDDISRMPEADIIYDELDNLENDYKNAEFMLTEGSPLLEAKSTDYEDFWIRSIGGTLYEKFVREYSKKMWQVSSCTEIDDFSWSPKGVAIKRGGREGWDTAISAYPTNYDGYNAFFDEASELCKHIKTVVQRVDPGTLSVQYGGEWESFDIIVNTAPLDDIFDNEHGALKYIGRRIEYLILPTEFVLPENTYFSYYCGDEEYTRVVEYKKFTQYSSPHTLISLEYPELNAGKYYPMPSDVYRSTHRKYIDLCNNNHFNAGRIALYNYRYDIDDVILQVRQIVDSL